MAARKRTKEGGKEGAVHPGPSQRVLRPRRRAPAKFPLDDRQSDGIGRGRPPGTNCCIRGGERYVSVLLSVPIQILRDSLVSESVGGRFLQFAKIRETVTDDPHGTPPSLDPPKRLLASQRLR